MAGEQHTPTSPSEPTGRTRPRSPERVTLTGAPLPLRLETEQQCGAADARVSIRVSVVATLAPQLRS
ncbi:hypothetical protein Dac01nite_01730 [Demequina activiva]|uniref:Uncharacterized protein n=1 Tax=Demequina activiva TaxID=1582364 RepID=A0A919Q1Z1_9MICO|nr:hypothetical protein Dac01nite_01730 [Demequina activiva]